jgi:acid phosphatase (class A)
MSKQQTFFVIATAAKVTTRLVRFSFAVVCLGAIPNMGHAEDLASASMPKTVMRDPATLTFPRSYWSPELRAKLLLIELLGSKWQDRLKLPPPPSDKEEIRREVEYLHSLVPLRAERRDEIKAQDETLATSFHPILMMTQWSHPRTHELMTFATETGILLLFYKDVFNRARPSQLSPQLVPLLDVPPHAAYPSGHAFQSRLVALVLAEVRPDTRELLLETAERIGFNREVAGLHFPSDSRASHSLADQVLAIAKEGSKFQALLAQAKAEWQ